MTRPRIAVLSAFAEPTWLSDARERLRPLEFVPYDEVPKLLHDLGRERFDATVLEVARGADSPCTTIATRHRALPIACWGATETESFAERTAPLVAVRSTDELVEFLTREVTTQARGRLAGVSLASIVQVMQLERRSCRLRARVGNLSGKLFIRLGALVHATLLSIPPRESALEMLSWTDAEVDFDRLPQSTPVTIEEPLDFLVIEAARVRDEVGPPRRSLWPGARPSTAPRTTSSAVAMSEELRQSLDRLAREVIAERGCALCAMIDLEFRTVVAMYSMGVNVANPVDALFDTLFSASGLLTDIGVKGRSEDIVITAGTSHVLLRPLATKAPRRRVRDLSARRRDARVLPIELRSTRARVRHRAVFIAPCANLAAAGDARRAGRSQRDASPKIRGARVESAFMKLGIAPLFACTLIAAAGCSSPPVMADGGEDRAAPSDITAPMDAREDVATMPDAQTTADASSDGGPAGVGLRCSATRPCPAGLACVDGTCQLDCSGNSRCNARCCAMGEVCAAGACTAPGAACTPTPGCGSGAGSCPSGQYCDAALMRCLPNTATGMCTVPAARSFRPVQAWAWPGSTARPEFKGVLATPIVADVDHDGASDVLVVAYKDPPASFGGNIAAQAIVCALSGAGDCMGGARELWCTEPQMDPTRDINAWGNIAVADLDATDGRNQLTIIAQMRLGPQGSGGIVAFDERGNRLWMGRRMDGTPVNTDSGLALNVGSFGSVAIADLEGDGRAEIIVGNTVFESTGVLRWQGTGACWGALGAHSFAADLSNPPDGTLEVLCGGTVYSSTGAVVWRGAGLPAGWGGVADFDGDGRPEVLVVNDGQLAMYRADGTPASAVTSFASVGLNGRGGAPTIADLDGDGTPEIGIAGASVYGALRVVPRPGNMFAFERAWTQPADDASSSSTGSAMFDFDGDGQYEVIYQDTCSARVFAGRDGAVLMNIPNISGTAANYPTVADLNADGRAEFITVSDSYYARSGIIPCPMTTPRTDGVRVFRDANDNWQSTRGIWNQFSYSVTNVCDGVDSVCEMAENQHGAIPRRPRASWSGSLNSFRVNAQLGLVPRRASDLVVLSLAANVSACPTEYVLRADVANRGALSAPAGTPVAFYRRDAMGMRTLLGTVMLSRALAPGGTARVELRVMPPAPGLFDVIAVVNDDGMGAAALRECNSDNNSSAPLSVDCTIIG